MIRNDRLPRPALILLAALAAMAPAVAYSEEAPQRGEALVSGRDVVAYPPGFGAWSFRYSAGSPYIAYDRGLLLTAAPGEERNYLLQVAPGKGQQGEGAATRSYLIDKRRPGVPVAEPGTGLYRARLEPRLSGEEGSTVFWSLVGPGQEPSFAAFGPDSRPIIEPPPSGTATYTLLAYAVDGAGNMGYPSRFVYRLAEAGLPAAAPAPESWAIASDPSLNKPEVDSARGYSELWSIAPTGAGPLLDVNPASPPDSLDDFERIAAEGGYARLRLTCPYGWTGELLVYYGVLKGDGTASFNPKPMTVRLSNPAEDPSPPRSPEGPILAADPSGRASFLLFPSYDGALFVSVEGIDPQPYAGPIALPAGKRSVKVSWYGEDPSGRRSPTRSLSQSMPETLPDVALDGVAEGAVVGGDVTLKPQAKATIRYELRLDGGVPSEPLASSPLLGESLFLACPPGEERSVAIRDRSFSGESGGEGRILRFTLDRKPPEAPRLVSGETTFTDRPLSLALAPGSGATEIYASVSADGAQAPYLPVDGELELPGSEAGAVSYLVRAYDIDAAGNRSFEMKTLSIVVDRSSVFVAEDGSDRGDGSPDRPFLSLDAGLAAALKAGKKSLSLRGAIEMRAPLVRATDIAIAGGFGPRWAAGASARARIRSFQPRGKAAFSQTGGSLSLKRVDIWAEDMGPEPLIELADAALVVEDSSISVASEGDLILVSAERSKIRVLSSRLKAKAAMSFTAFSADSCDVSLVSSSVSAEAGVRFFGAFDTQGGSLALRESLVESRADLGINLLSLRSTSLLVDRSLIKAEGGSGYLRIGSFTEVSGELRNSKVLLSWKGPGTLFEIEGGGPAFTHDTIVADSAAGGLRFFDSKGSSPQLWNSILECSAPDSELIRADRVPAPGSIVADCVWGFERLLAGAREAGDLASLNALNAGSPFYDAKPIISEAPERSFAAPLKSQATLRADSACVDAAMPLEGGGYEVDFAGRPRSGSGPDIGADELAG